MKRTMRPDHYATPAKLLFAGSFHKNGLFAASRGKSTLLPPFEGRSSSASDSRPL